MDNEGQGVGVVAGPILSHDDEFHPSAALDGHQHDSGRLAPARSKGYMVKVHLSHFLRAFVLWNGISSRMRIVWAARSDTRLAPRSVGQMCDLVFSNLAWCRLPLRWSPVNGVYVIACRVQNWLLRRRTSSLSYRHLSWGREIVSHWMYGFCSLLVRQHPRSAH